MFFDITGALLSLLSTYYFIRLNNKAWMIGIIATGVNGWLYWQKGIYADMVLEFFYFLSMIYGLYRWREVKDNRLITLQTLTKNQWSWLCLVLCLIFVSIYCLLSTLTHSSVAIMDAATTSLSLMAQWLMCHKIIATWVLWFITDVIYAIMYLNKGLPVHSALMLIYTGMAVTGYFLWARNNSKHLTQITISV